MRRDFLLIGSALLAGGAIGSIAILDPGYVRVEFVGWIAESNLIVAVAVLCLAYFVMRILLRFLSALMHSGASLSQLRERYKHGKALARARVGILEFAAGNWQQAADQLAAAAVHSSEPVTIWLNAAAAARKAGDVASMRQAIAEARNLTGDVPELSLMEARWHIEDGDTPEAVKILRTLDEISETRIAEGRQLLLARAFHDLEDWDSLASALKVLKKSKGVAPEAYRAFEIAQARAAFDLIETRATTTGVAPTKKDADAAWKQVPKHLRNEPLLVRRRMEVEQWNSLKG